MWSVKLYYLRYSLDGSEPFEYYRHNGVQKVYKATFFFPHVSRAQRLVPARTRTRVVRLGAQCTDHWTTGQSRGVGVPAIQLTTHVKSSTLCGRTVVGSYIQFFSA